MSTDEGTNKLENMTTYGLNHALANDLVLLLQAKLAGARVTLSPAAAAGVYVTVNDSKSDTYVQVCINDTKWENNALSATKWQPMSKDQPLRDVADRLTARGFKYAATADALCVFMCAFYFAAVK